MFDSKHFMLSMPAVILIACLIYSNHFHNAFHFDDFHSIQENAYIHDLGNIPKFFADCTTSSSMSTHQGYRPVVMVTLAPDYYLNELFLGE